MKQLLQNLASGRTSVEQVPMPLARPGMALVRTAASLVSAGTERMVVEFAHQSLLGKARSRPDLVRQVLDRARRDGLLGTVRAAFNRLDQPMALGYSSAGTIVELGAGMSGFKVGERVACAGGGYAVHAEYASVPRNLMASLPSTVDFETAAFATLGAIGMHGFRLAQPQVGERVAVIGLGLLGLLTIQIAAAGGCQTLGIDVDPARVRLASSLGLKAVTHARAAASAQAFTANRGFDVVLICADTTSNDPVELAAVIARDRARLVALGAVGLSIPRRLYYEKELSFINSRSYGPGRYDSSYEEQGHDYPIGQVRWTEGRNLQSVVELMAAGKLIVKPLVTHRFPIDKAAIAYDVITARRKEPFLGVLLTYGKKFSERRQKIQFRAVRAKPSSVGLGVVGAGSFANATLLPAIKRAGNIELVGITSAGGLHAQHTARKFGFAYAASSPDDVLKDPRVNTIAILTRHESHARLVVQALKAGKNVFVEKPLAINLEEVSLVSRQLSKRGNCLLTVGFNRRFSPLGQVLRAFLSPRAEAMHAHYRVNAGYLAPEHWTQDAAFGGRIIGEACHFVDFIAFLVGAVPISVIAHALPDAGKYREDNVSMTFSFQDGSVGVIDYLANGDRSVPKERLEVFCAEKVAVLNDFRSLEMWEGGVRKEMKTPQDKGWVNEWKAFAVAIREGGEPPIPYDHLIGVTKATIAAVKSIRSQLPVPI